MKPPPLRYHDPATVDEAVGVLRDVGAGGKILAGGQSLIPLLNMRLTAPSDLVDINGVAGLDEVTVDGDGVRVGAAVRQRALERHAGALRAVPLLGDALPLVAHPVIRNRGTVVGSIAHADPAAELTAVLALTDGWVEVVAAGRPPRRVAARDWFLGPLEADLRPGDLVTAVGFGAQAPGAGTAFVELSRRHGDYAVCGIAAVVEVDADGITAARVATISVHPIPLVVDVTQAVGGLRAGPSGGEREGDAFDAAGAVVAGQVDPDADLHATVAYRRHLTRVLTARALRAAFDRTVRDPAPVGSDVSATPPGSPRREER